MALAVKTAATVESTPPESPQITWQPFVFLCIRATIVSIQFPRSQSPEHEQTSKRNLERIAVPF